MVNVNEIRVLLIEDDEVDVMAFKRMLKKVSVKCELTSFNTPIQAIAHFKTDFYNYDCVFIDYLLPGANGLSVLNSLKKIRKEIPMIVLTSHGDEKVAVEMMKAGAFDYFPKSELNVKKIQELLASMRQWLALNEEKYAIQKELEEHQTFIKKVTESSPNIIFVYDPEKKQNIYTNRNIYEELGYTSEQIEEHGNGFFEKIIHEDDKEKINKFINRLLNSDKDIILEAEYRLKDAKGNWQWFLDKNTIFKRSNTGKPIEIIGTSFNITERKKIEEELIKAKKQAENAAKIKSDFLSNMSHEIRTPMNAIMGLTEILMDAGFQGQDLENLKTIKLSGDNLIVIINDILDYSKMDAGKVKVQSIPFLIEEQLSLVEKTIAKKVELSKVNFVIKTPKNIPKGLIGDPYRLNQILLNLISNAVKFTHKGKVELCISQVGETINNNIKLCFKVIDTGIGIPSDKLDAIFESFTQANLFTTRNYGGTGLGLAITQKLVELMKGSIDVESIEGIGSTFTVCIPFSIASDIESKPKAKTKKFNKSLKEIKVLVVEDQRINQMVIRQIFNKWDNSPKIAQEDFDIVCMDLQMPVCDGFEATHIIRNKLEKVRNHNIPIIALSADALPETRKKVLDIGMNDYITKPPDLEELYKKIMQFF